MLVYRKISQKKIHKLKPEREQRWNIKNTVKRQMGNSENVVKISNLPISKINHNFLKLKKHMKSESQVVQAE